MSQSLMPKTHIYIQIQNIFPQQNNAKNSKLYFRMIYGRRMNLEIDINHHQIGHRKPIICCSVIPVETNIK